MASTTTTSVSTPGGLSYQNYMNKKVIKNFEPELYFYKMGKKQLYSGYKTISWSRINRLTATVAQATLSEGITPTDQNLTEQTLTVNPVQYGLYVTLTDQLIEIVPIEIISEGLEAVGNNLARVIDQVIQSMLLTTGSNVIFGGTATSRPTLTATDVANWKTVAQAVSFLKVKAAKRYSEDAYVGVFHTNVTYDLFTETTTGGFIDVTKYKMPENYFNGEIGKIAGCRIIECPFVQTVASTIPYVYPSYIFGADAYGIGQLMDLQTYDTGFNASDTDPLAQRRKLGAKTMFGSVVLRQESMIRLETASSLNGAMFFFS